MPCDPIVESGRVTGFACSRSRQRPESCYICGKPAIRLCDYEDGDGSCDRPMCRKHSHHTVKDTDYCGEHYQKLVSRQTTL